METYRLPFEISGLYAGCAKLDGMIIVSAEHLLLEYRLTDTLIRAFNGELQTRRVAWTELERAEHGNGFFSPWLVLTARTMSTFDKLPSKNPGQLRLSIPWKQRQRLRTVTSEINLLLSYQEADRFIGRLP